MFIIRPHYKNQARNLGRGGGLQNKHSPIYYKYIGECLFYQNKNIINLVKYKV